MKNVKKQCVGKNEKLNMKILPSLIPTTDSSWCNFSLQFIFLSCDKFVKSSLDENPTHNSYFDKTPTLIIASPASSDKYVLGADWPWLWVSPGADLRHQPTSPDERSQKSTWCVSLSRKPALDPSHSQQISTKNIKLKYWPFLDFLLQNV